jgi:hypothetical protein
LLKFKNSGAYEIKNMIIKNNYKFAEANLLNTVRLFGQNKPSRVLIGGQMKEWKYNLETKVRIVYILFDLKI